MKSILLTTSALVAFAGAAAAEGHTSIDFSGEATAEFNDQDGYSTSAELTATMSAELDNGLTASAEVTFDPVASSISYGSISLSSDNASLTFGTGLDGAVQTAIGDDYDIGQSANAARDDFEEALDGVVGSYTMGATTLTVALPIDQTNTSVDSDAVEVGVQSTLGGWTVGLGVMGSGDYAATAEGTVGGADLNFGFSSNDEWDVGVDYAIGAVTLSASTDESEVWTVGADYDGGDYTAGFEYNSNETWEVSAGYAAGAIAVDVEYTSAEVLTLGATYDVGSGVTVGGGMIGDDTYAFAAMDLGGGASAYIEYADAAADLEEVGPSERDIALGATVGVSFEF